MHAYTLKCRGKDTENVVEAKTTKNWVLKMEKVKVHTKTRGKGAQNNYNSHWPIPACSTAVVAAQGSTS
jgi:hypothetical protein